MLQFVIAGLVLGGIYAIASAGLVITYTSSARSGSNEGLGGPST
jgi:branched-subunit amino acid ABC-type transport system permease component